MKRIFLVFFVAFTGFLVSGSALCSSQLPRVYWSEGTFQYKGAFLLPSGVHGYGEFNNTGGAIGLSEDGASFFIQGKKVLGTDSGIAEVEIPRLKNTDVVSELNTAGVKQNFVKMMTKASAGNPQENDEYRGIYSYKNKLIIAAMKIYDGKADNTQFLLRVDAPNDLTNSFVGGFYGIKDNARTAGWISAVPREWQSKLGCKHLMGNSNGYSINSRLSIGPSAYCVDLDDIISANTDGEIIDSIALMSFSMEHQMQKNINPDWNLNNALDLESTSITPQGNDVLTYLSKGAFGFIVPGTRTYAVFGTSSGHESGVGYKIIQNNGNLCSGYCSVKYDDWSNYVWFFDLNDFALVKQGEKAAHSLVPYAYGPIDTVFETNDRNIKTEIGGGAYDEEKGILYLVQTPAYIEGYARLPVITAYKINVPRNVLPSPPGVVQFH